MVMMNMLESEDDRRSREKFVRERDYSDRPRREFFDRNRRDYNGVGAGIKRAVSRQDDEQTLKKNRSDRAVDSYEPQFLHKDEDGSPVMLTFKKFLATRDESLTDQEAIIKYVEYKDEFVKQECDRYFQSHKDEEWFRLKYHPDVSSICKEAQRTFANRRLEIFNEFLNCGMFDNVNLDSEKASSLIRLMFSVVIKLEGGTNDDVEALKDEIIEDESIIELNKATRSSGSNSDDSGDKSKQTKLPSTAESNSEAVEMAADQSHKSCGAIKVEEVESETKSKRKVVLHKTSSIFFRNIPTTMKIAELENICKEHPGFLRICLTDPLPETKNARRGWATYRPDVNIKEIFWNLRNKRNDVDFGASVNRELRRRIRSINGIAIHRCVVQNDIKQAAKLIALFDFKTKLFIPDDEETYQQFISKDLETAIVKSKNPILMGVIDYLVEEEDAEEELLLGQNEKAKESSKILFEIDRKLIQALDKLLLYLRIVHSIDFYNACEYPNEDLLPNRLGILHVRGKPPSETLEKNEDDTLLISKPTIDEYTSGFNDRLASLFKNIPLEASDLDKLGRKDPQKAVDDFINANCVEMAKDKWLCPLSGKKFKGPEFIHKHLHSKYQENIDQVRNEAIYFNNFLMDPTRPLNLLLGSIQPVPSSPATLQSAATAANTATNVVTNQPRLLSNNIALSEDGRPHGDYPTERPHRPNWQPNQGSSDRFMGVGGPHRFMGGRGPNFGRDFNRPPRYFDPSDRRDPRPTVIYHDLDAPEEIF